MTDRRWDSALYEAHHGFVSRLGEGLIDLLAPQPGERVLDLGCGTGHLTQQIADSGACVTGLDSDAAMLRQARANYPQLRFIQADGQDFQVDAPFDAIFSNAALHWMPDANGAAACMARALRPGGRLVAEFGGAGNVRRLYEAFCAALGDVGQQVPGRFPWYFPAATAYSALLEAQGFQVLGAQHFPRPTPLDGEDGLRNWYAMFLGEALERLDAGGRERVLDACERQLRPTQWRDGHWVADYVRLRVVARLRQGP
ncbi:MAG: methyltransferase domain-containing protein [Anaerolineaceae bacterium]|nr:methyltransferase domain-containing protein [Anaerolineaceae bacterium]